MIRQIWKNYFRYLKVSNKESYLALSLGVFGAFLETSSIYLLANLITNLESNNQNLNSHPYRPNRKTSLPQQLHQHNRLKENVFHWHN